MSPTAVVAAALSAPPPCAQGFVSDDLDEVRAVLDGYGKHARVVRGRGRLGYGLRWAPAPSVTIAWHKADLAQSLRAASLQSLVHVSLNGGAEYVFGRRAVQLPPWRCTFIPPEIHYTRHATPGRALALIVDSGALQRELAAQQQRPVGGTCQPGELAVAAVAASGLLPAVAALVASMKRQDAAAVDQEHQAAAVLSALAEALIDTGAAQAPLEASGVTPQRMRQLEAWIDAHLTEPITLGRLCEVFGLGARSLQLAFARRWAMSPLRYVAERRIESAFVRLSAAGPQDDVTRVVSACGITHLGRFSVAYRRLFGEPPSQTLRRAQRRA